MQSRAADSESDVVWKVNEKPETYRQESKLEHMQFHKQTSFPEFPQTEEVEGWERNRQLKRFANQLHFPHR